METGKIPALLLGTRMSGRLLAVAIIIGSAAPAAAGERHGYIAQPDALALLMQDKAVAGGLPRAIGFDVRGAPDLQPAASDMAGFDRLAAAGTVFAVATPADRPTPRSRSGIIEAGTHFPGLHAVAEALVNRNAPVRPRALNGSVIFRLDGDEESPSLSLGGAAAVLNLLPRR